MQRLKFRFNNSRFALLLPHFEAALTEGLLTIDEVISILGTECVECTLTEQNNDTSRSD